MKCFFTRPLVAYMGRSIEWEEEKILEQKSGKKRMPHKIFHNGDGLYETIVDEENALG